MPSRGRIAVFSIDAKLGDEVRGATRYTFLAQLLHEHGYEVDFITSRFQHWDKRHRDASFDPATDAYAVRFIDEPGYPANMCPQRIWSHRIAAKNLTAYFEQHHDYDLIYCQIPPNDATLAAGRAAKRYGIPFVIDVNDLWPEAFRVALDVPVLSDVLFAPFYRQAKQAYALADAVVGTSDEYASRAFKDRGQDIPKVVVYVGNDIDEFDEGAREFAGQIEKPAGELWVTYAGTLSACYDIDTLIRAMAEVQRTHPEAKLKLLGDGGERAHLFEAASETGCDVEFLGYQPYRKMAAYLCASDILVNSLVGKAAQSIVTKIGDYLAAGKPLINAAVGAEFRHKVEEDGFGVNVQPGDASALSAALVRLIEDAAARERMGKRARGIAEQQFARRVAYQSTVQLIDDLVREGKHGR
ncbi:MULTISPECIES: glycosyltransferase family 4 protein [Enorma]|uniref:glycosyltransferase family 4 protein n=1 Tax=Enorma TaxID=1472762 RepID=UPI0004AD74D6|nr:MULTISPECIES: glycosyltransferase family 4 protein [Enorma]